MKISTGRCTAVMVAACMTMVACSGGGDGGDQYLGATSTSTCATGVSACSGDAETGRIGALRLTASGVQTIAASTNDLLATPRQRGLDAQIAYGLAPLDQGLAGVRVVRASDGAVTAVNLRLSGLGLSWDGTRERPTIIETFGLPRGRVQASTGGMASLAALPAANDTTFWNNNPATGAGTQANYANNIYFARELSTAHCTEGDAACVTAAQNGLRLRRGDWRSGGIVPDQVQASRLHEDGATQAPEAIPFAGFKGYRDLWNWNYRHAHLAGWITQDTVSISEWGGDDEHNKSRRGVIAYGEPTPAASLPNGGTVRYAGLAHGWYSPNGAIEPYPIAADVEISVDFAAHTARVRLFNLRIDEDQNPSPQLIAESSNTVPVATGTNRLGGPVTHGDASGHLGARFYGPVSNGAPPEIVKVFSGDVNLNGWPWTPTSMICGRMTAACAGMPNWAGAKLLTMIRKTRKEAR